MDHAIGADDTVTALEFTRCDNGPELTAHALADWCITSHAGTQFIDPAIPWQNAWIESFNARSRYECLAFEEFTSLLEAQIVIADRYRDYDDYRPHSTLGTITPTSSQHDNHGRHSQRARTKNQGISSWTH